VSVINHIARYTYKKAAYYRGFFIEQSLCIFFLYFIDSTVEINLCVNC